MKTSVVIEFRDKEDADFFLRFARRCREVEGSVGGALHGIICAALRHAAAPRLLTGEADKGEGSAQRVARLEAALRYFLKARQDGGKLALAMAADTAEAALAQCETTKEG